MRNWHYLHASRAVGWPHQSIALSVACSTPTQPDNGQVTRPARLLGWAAIAWLGPSGEAQEVRRADGIDATSFWRWLIGRLKPGRSTWIWQLHACHGLTALGFWDALTQRHWEICGHDYRERQPGTEGASRASGLCVVSDPPTILLARPAGGSHGAATYVDVRNLSPHCSWDDLFASQGTVGQYKRGRTDWLTGREIARARSVALIRWLVAWYATVRELNLGGLRATAAAQAWHGWRTHYLNVPVEVHNDEERLRAERQAIYGGRNELYSYRSAAVAVCQLDASAHYPACAQSTPLPGRVARGCVGTGRGWQDATRAGALVIGRGRVYTDTPCLPYKREGGTVYPVGSWIGTYCQPELDLLARCGGRFDCERWWAYEPTDCCAKYVEALFAYRRRVESLGDGGQSDAVKLLMNSLVGRFAAIGRYWQDEPGEFHPDPWAQWQAPTGPKGELERWRSIGWRVQREVEAGEHPESVPALAAWVYSLGRVRLWQWMELAGREEVLYVDTDSLWTTRAGYDRLVSAGAVGSGELGALRVEHWHSWARFYGHKHYETPRGVTCAGVPRSAVLSTDNGWTFWGSHSPAQAARSGRAPQAELMRYDVAERSDYRGGRIGADGTVYPYEVYDE